MLAVLSHMVTSMVTSLVASLMTRMTTSLVTSMMTSLVASMMTSLGGVLTSLILVLMASMVASTTKDKGANVHTQEELVLQGCEAGPGNRPDPESTESSEYANCGNSRCCCADGAGCCCGR